MWRKTSRDLGLGTLAYLLLSTACGGDDSGTDDVQPPSQPDEKAPDASDGPGMDQQPIEYAVCDPGINVGGFRIDLAADNPVAKQFSSVSGKVENGVVPLNVPLMEDSAGDCQLLKSPSFSCDPSCSANETCGPDGCVPYPEGQDVGTVSIMGLKVPLEMTPSASSKSYSNPASAMLPHPATDVGANIVLSASGGTYEFEIRGVGIAPIKVAEEPIRVAANQPVVVSWDAAAAGAPSRVVLNLNIDNHGSTAARIRCETADDGEAEIPASLVDALLEKGFSGYPTLAIRRQFSSTASIAPGCIELLVVSELVSDVQIDGLTSCGDNADCEAGQTCQEDLTCK